MVKHTHKLIFQTTIKINTKTEAKICLACGSHAPIGFMQMKHEFSDRFRSSYTCYCTHAINKQ